MVTARSFLHTKVYNHVIEHWYRKLRRLCFLCKTNLQMLLLYTANPYILQTKEHVVRVPKQFVRKSQSLVGYLSINILRKLFISFLTRFIKRYKTMSEAKAFLPGPGEIRTPLGFLLYKKRKINTHWFKPDYSFVLSRMNIGLFSLF